MGRTLSRLFRGMWYFPKTAYINFRTLPFGKAVKFPFVVMGKCSFKGLNKKTVRIDAPVKTGMIKIGAQKTSKRGIPINRQALMAVENGLLIFQGSASIGAGTSICASGGTITLGDEFSCNVNCFIYSQKGIMFGKDVLLGWNVNIRDNDGHPLYDRDGNVINPNREVLIGDHVWIASYVDVLKGTNLAEGVIVGTRSLVTKAFEEKNQVIAGIPAKTVKRDVYWKHR